MKELFLWAVIEMEITGNYLDKKQSKNIDFLEDLLYSIDIQDCDRDKWAIPKQNRKWNVIFE